MNLSILKDEVVVFGVMWAVIIQQCFQAKMLPQFIVTETEIENIVISTYLASLEGCDWVVQ